MFKVYRKLFAYVPEKKYLIYISIVLSVLSTFAIVGAYYYLYLFFDGLITRNDLPGSAAYAWVIFGLLIGGNAVYFIGVLASHVLGFRLETNLRKRGIDGLAGASFRFFDLNSSGRIRKIIDDNASQTHTIVAHLLPDIANALAKPFLLLIAAFIVSPRVGIGLTILTIAAILLYSGMSGETQFMNYYQQALERLSAESVEYVRGIQVVKIFHADARSFKALYGAGRSCSKFALNYSMSCKVPWVLLQWAMFGIVAIIVPFIFLLPGVFTHGTETAVELLMLMFLSGVMFSTIMKVMYVVMYSFNGAMAVEKLEDMYEEMHKDSLEHGTREDFTGYDIEFSHVTFGYGEKTVLKDVSFTLKQNHSYALVGASGSGKSTIAKLISGFYKVDEGVIRIGGQPLEEYSEKAVLENIAFVFQDVKLFKTSLYENVALADPSADHEKVMEAFRRAGCDSILDKFKERENTLIGSKGVYLSGGEKQRIGIARAILKNARIVIMDEASAAVDPENEHELQKAFAELMKDKTVIMIAHRLTSVRNVDEILVIEGGKVIERGSDKELMAGDSRYKFFQDMYAQANEWRVSEHA